jgi:hypothetical protein
MVSNLGAASDLPGLAKDADRNAIVLNIERNIEQG